MGRGASRKRPLKNSERQRGESKDRKQEGKQTKLKTKVTPLPIMSGSFKKPSLNCLEEEERGKRLERF